MIRVRFAPSPTGYLHLGNIRTALFNYLFAKKNKGQFLLRIEDTDTERSKREYEESQKEDLLWMGLRWDEGPDVGGPCGSYRQSERLEIYREFVDDLIKKQRAYYCYVTEEEVEEMKRVARLEKKPPRFDNRGRNFSEPEIERRKAKGIKPTIRFRIKEPELILHDMIRGTVKFNLEDMVGDFVIVKADGMPTFHLAVCIDDALMKVTHVIRGEDHLSNTPKHVMLTEAMGLMPPMYGHLPLVNGPGGEPLSKRMDSISVRHFRKQGYLPEALANYIALLGWSAGDNREIFKFEELIESFDLARVGKSPAAYDPQKLNWVNGEHLRKLADQDFARKSLAYLKEQKLLRIPEPLAVRTLPVFKDSIDKFEDLGDRLGFMAEDFSYEEKGWLTREPSKNIFKRAILLLPDLAFDNPEVYQVFIDKLKPEVTVKGKDLFMPLRVALTGREHGPELKKLFPILGRDFITMRLKKALEVV